MAEQSQSTQHWPDTWADIQRKAWESWSQVAQQALAGSRSTAFDPWRYWQEGMERWREVFFPNVDAAGQAVYRKVLDQGMDYLRMSQDLVKTVQGMQSAVQMGEDWMKVVSNVFEQAKDACARMSTDGNDMVRGCLALWGLPLATWHRVASSLSLFPGDTLQGVKEADVRHVGETLQANLQRFLSIPPVGYTREWQEQGQEAAQHWLQYQQALSAYLGMMVKVSGHALELLQRRLLEMGAEGKQVESLRQFYDLWVDCSEEAYAEVASAVEFGEVNARLVNASMALKRQSQRMMEEMIGGINLPSRRELDTAHYRVHELKRELKAMQEQLKTVRAADAPAKKPPADGAGREVKALRREVEALRSALVDIRAEPAAEEKGTVKPARTAGSKAPGRKPRQAKGG